MRSNLIPRERDDAQGSIGDGCILMGERRVEALLDVVEASTAGLSNIMRILTLKSSIAVARW